MKDTMYRIWDWLKEPVSEMQSTWRRRTYCIALLGVTTIAFVVAFLSASGWLWVFLCPLAAIWLFFLILTIYCWKDKEKKQ